MTSLLRRRNISGGGAMARIRTAGCRQAACAILAFVTRHLHPNCLLLEDDDYRYRYIFFIR